ncbi:MAG: hypothetical protein ACOC3A_11495 [Thermodesulfobacteriota bacterium]
MKFTRSIFLTMLCVFASSWAWIPGGGSDIEQGRSTELRDAILAVRAMEDMAGVQAPVPFSRAFSKTLRVARAAAGLDEAIGQDKDGIPVVQAGTAVLPSLLSVSYLKPKSSNIENSTSKLASRNLQPEPPPPRIFSYLISV